VFVLDASTSVGDKNFDAILHFVSSTLTYADIDSGRVRVGAMVYSSTSLIQFNLDRYSSKTGVMRAIARIPYQHGSTNTADALNMMRTEMFRRRNGDRSDATNVAILVTDGISNIDHKLTIPAALEAHAAGVHIYTVGIGLTDTAELESISTPPSFKNTFSVQRFDQLMNLQEELSRSICAGFSVQPYTCRLGCLPLYSSLVYMFVYVKQYTSRELYQGEVIIGLIYW
jgi:collagen type VI alpha